MGLVEIGGAVVLAATVFGLNVSTFVAVVAGIIIPTLGFLGGSVWWFHKRVRKLESSEDDREAVVYGAEDNPLNIGLVKEVKTLKEDLNRAEEKRQELREQQLEILRRLESIETKLDEYNGNGKDDED